MNSIKNVNKQSLVFIGVSILVTVCAAGLLYYMYGQVTSSNREVASLNTKVDELDSKNKDLGSKNANLKNTVEAFQNQLDQDSKVNSSDNQLPRSEGSAKPVAKMVIREVRDQAGTDYSVPGKVPYPDVRVVHLTITNLTDTPQDYNWHQFEATLKDGQMVKGLTYGPLEGTNWVQSKLAPGGSQNIELLFKRSQDLALLSWAPPQATKPLVVTVPSPIPLP